MHFSKQDIELLYLYLNIEHSINPDIKKQFNELMDNEVNGFGLFDESFIIEEAETEVDKSLQQIIIEDDRNLVINTKLDKLLESNKYTKEIINLLLMLTLITGGSSYTQPKQRFVHKVAIRSDINMNIVIEKEDLLQTLFVLVNLREWLETEGKDIPFQDAYLNEEQANFHFLMETFEENMED